MTIGIYRLIFPNTDKCYIGQSVNIERRYMQHLRSFELGGASAKLQNAYNVYGKPKLDILLDGIDLSELDTCENEAIQIFDSFHNGFNQLEYADEMPNNPRHGINHGNQKYSEEQLYNSIILLAVPDITLSEICNKTGIPAETLASIAKGRVHKWLADRYPNEYSKILSGHRNSYATRKAKLPKVVQPDGTVFEIYHLSSFAKMHNLDHSALSKVLHGKQRAHKGWKPYE